MNMPEFTAGASLGLGTTAYHRAVWSRGAGAGMTPSQIGAITPARFTVGDTFCAGTTMWRYQCTPSRFPGSPPSCEFVAVGSCPGYQSGPFWSA